MPRSLRRSAKPARPSARPNGAFLLPDDSTHTRREPVSLCLTAALCSIGLDIVPILPFWLRFCVENPALCHETQRASPGFPMHHDARLSHPCVLHRTVCMMPAQSLF